jgi:flagellar biosynthesis component FlhA
MDLTSVKKTDLGVALYLLAAIIFLIIPIPSVLLDVMLAEHFHRLDCADEYTVCQGSVRHV